MVRKKDTIPKIPLTAEEKKKKVEEMQAKIKQRRVEKANLEKAEVFDTPPFPPIFVFSTLTLLT